jgi:hypothetical protein
MKESSSEITLPSIELASKIQNELLLIAEDMNTLSPNELHLQHNSWI